MTGEDRATNDDEGKPRDATGMRVLDSGSDAVSVIKGPVKKVEMAKMPWGS